ncbi:MAG: ABC-2 family transporter protein, partial [Clostridium sp.]|nr:ABC-2 family transporter protein [Clostridium sp.]
LNGWGFDELLFIYGFAQIPRGIDHLLTDNVWMIAFRLVIRGEFDRYLLRPMNPFFQVISDKFQPDALGELLMGFCLIGISIQKGIVQVTFINIILFIISVLAGALIYTDIKLFFASLAFWVQNSGGILQLAYNMSDFAKYPISIYSKPVRVLLSTLVPFAFVAFYDIQYQIIDGNE